MTSQTLTSMYDTRDLAESARDQLVGIGVTRDAITIHGADAGTAASSAAVNEDKGFWASLADFFMPDEDRYTYTEGLKRGGYLLSARVPDELEEAAADILEGSDPSTSTSVARAGGRKAGQATTPRRPPTPAPLVPWLMAKAPAWMKPLAGRCLPELQLPLGQYRLYRRRPWHVPM